MPKLEKEIWELDVSSYIHPYKQINRKLIGMQALHINLKRNVFILGQILLEHESY